MTKPIPTTYRTQQRWALYTEATAIIEENKRSALAATQKRMQKLAEDVEEFKHFKGAIYLIEAVGSDCLKIGWVRSAGGSQERLDKLQIGCPFPLKLRAVIDHASKADEFRLHMRFKAEFVHGEWFKINGALEEWVLLLESDPTLGAVLLADCVEFSSLTTRASLTL